MSAMAKRYHQRTHVSIRKKKEEEQKLQKRRAFYQKHKKQLIAGGAALLALIVGVWLAVDYFYAPAGSLRMFMGNLVGVEQDWLVRNLGTSRSPRYYKFGEFTPLEGYADQSADNNFSSDKKEQSFYYAAEDEAATVQRVYVSGVKEKTGEEMIETLLTSGTYTETGEAKTGALAGIPVRYLYTIQENTEPAGTYTAALVVYADTVQHSSVLVNLFSGKAAKDALPGEDAMVAEAEEILAHLTLPQA